MHAVSRPAIRMVLRHISIVLPETVYTTSNHAVSERVRFFIAVCLSSSGRSQAGPPRFVCRTGRLAKQLQDKY
jgi:hypothetical protein